MKRRIAFSGYTSLKVFKGVFDALVNLFPCPHMAVFEVLKDINLPGSCLCSLFPAAPICVIFEIVLSGTGLKDLVS